MEPWFMTTNFDNLCRHRTQLGFYFGNSFPVADWTERQCQMQNKNILILVDLQQSTTAPADCKYLTVTVTTKYRLGKFSQSLKDLVFVNFYK